MTFGLQVIPVILINIKAIKVSWFLENCKHLHTLCKPTCKAKYINVMVASPNAALKELIG